VSPPEPEPSDEDLAMRARDGDRRATEDLLRRHQDRIARICRRLCRDRHDAEDATQDALLAIATGLARFDGRSAFATWAYRIAVNRSLDELRRRRRRPEPVAPDHRAPDHRDPDHRRGPGAAEPPDPADLAVAARERDRVLGAMALLPDEFREAVVLRDVLDLDYAEIARLLGVAPGTVRSRIARGRGRLADALREPPVPAGNRNGPADVGPVSERTTQPTITPGPSHG
jgi:RNA polymerase sigma-70 factor (ECF subfamily)